MKKLQFSKEVGSNIKSKKCLADRLGITTSSLSTIIKNRKEIEECLCKLWGEICFAAKIFKNWELL